MSTLVPRRQALATATDAQVVAGVVAARLNGLASLGSTDLIAEHLTYLSCVGVDNFGVGCPIYAYLTRCGVEVSYVADHYVTVRTRDGLISVPLPQALIDVRRRIDAGRYPQLTTSAGSRGSFAARFRRWTGGKR
jgi:hypothetical protein